MLSRPKHPTDARRRAPSGAGEPTWAELHKELDRSRRYDHSFVMLRIHLPAAPGDPAAADPVALLRALNRFLRRADRSWHDGPVIQLLLPESDIGAAEGLLDRVGRQAPDLLAGTSIRFAVFPDDGLTASALLDGLRRNEWAGGRREASGDSGACAPGGLRA